MSSKQIAIVTGANRGLGLETCRQLARRGVYPVLTSRDPHKGEVAAEQLRSKGLEVGYHQLDVTEVDSIRTLFTFVEKELGRADVLVNNAAIYYDSGQWAVDADLNIVQAAFDTNVLGPWRMCKAFIPLLRQSDSGRIVNVSSGSGALSEMSGGTPAYGVSKAALNALTIKLAEELRGSGILVNAVCPGWVRTDMGGSSAPRSVEQGARGIVWAATLPNDGPTGGFFRDAKPIEW